MKVLKSAAIVLISSVAFSATANQGEACAEAWGKVDTCFLSAAKGPLGLAETASQDEVGKALDALFERLESGSASAQDNKLNSELEKIDQKCVAENLPQECNNGGPN